MQDIGIARGSEIGRKRALFKALLYFACSLFALFAFEIAKPYLFSLLSSQLDNNLVTLAQDAAGKFTASLLVIFAALTLAVYFFLSRSLGALSLVVLSFVLAFSLLLRGLQIPLCIDDAYIDFRYVRNFLSGAGLVFQEADRNILGISSCLHIFLLVALGKLFSCMDIAGLSRALNLFLEAGNLILLYGLVFRLSRSAGAALLATAIYGLNDYSIYEVVRGKETPLVVLLLLSYFHFAFYSLKSHSHNMARATCAGLLALTRPEGLFFLLSDVLMSWKKERKIAVVFSCYLPFLALLALSALSIFFMVGSFVPSGMMAKWLVYDRPAYFGFAQLGQYLLSNVFTLNLICVNDALAYPLSFILYFLLLTAFSLILWGKEIYRPYLLTLYILGLFFGGLNAVMAVFPWYYSWWALLPSLIWATLYIQLKAKQPAMALSAALLILVATVQGWSRGLPGEYFYRLGNFHLPLFRLDMMQGRLPAYESAAAFINERARAGELVAVGELGVLSYHLSKVRLLDLHGIISPVMLPLYKERGHLDNPQSLIVFPAKFAETFKPQWICAYDIFLDKNMLGSDSFRRDYDLVKFYPYSFYDSRGLFIYKRR